MECDRPWGTGSPTFVSVERPPLRPVVNTGRIDDKPALSAMNFVFGLIDAATALSRASVYRIAAGGNPATLPKLPCLSINNRRMFHS